MQTKVGRDGFSLTLQKQPAPGKRLFTSMAPLIVRRGGKPIVALGLPGGLRIFGSAMQAVINLVDHGMSLQQAMEARGHRIARVRTIGGGINGIAATRMAP